MVVLLLYGLYAALTMFSIYCLKSVLNPRDEPSYRMKSDAYCVARYQHQATSHSRKILLCTVSLMFINHSGLVAATSICFVDDMKGLYTGVNGRLNFQAQLVEVVLARANYLLSDFIVIWRAWCFSNGRGKSRYVLSLCLLASFVTLTVDGALSSLTLSKVNTEKYSPALSSVALLPRNQWGNRKIAMPLVLFTTNFVATIYIGMAFRMVRRVAKGYLVPSKKISIFGQMLLFMFESGLVYSALWLVLAFDIAYPFPHNVNTVITVVVPQITALYPAVIIVLDVAQKSMNTQSEQDSETIALDVPTARSDQSDLAITQISTR
ncbi:hypothetical protein GYMLUDRAFT_63510 [Collybiopsis luxurians FD-317 M1]|uniref:Uncharacterized protein n=1 Tax=Collybiopsis luxurians FD-317 M1 TaxID=944289 RepID=A0A0D0CFW9_9AGAR|nr:hypothetical protein GYMLUDRAFT_63510 [Collybiopsis luxurians FD-317 M1]